MKTKVLIPIFPVVLAATSLKAQNETSADSLTHELKEAVVTAKQPVTQLIGTTLVSNISGSNLANLGNALDVLEQLPMIKVRDNTVSVIGKSNIEIYINGRPMRDNMELQEILSSDLKKVELLMAPGAAYGSSTGAVLKITVKRKFAQGLSLTDQFQLHRRRKWSAMDHLSLSYRSVGWDFFLSGVINRDNSVFKGSTVNSLIYQNHETVVGSSQYNCYPTRTGSVNAGFNHAKGDRFFGANYRYSPERGDFSNNGTEWINNSMPLNRVINKNIRAYAHLFSTYYENKFGGRYLVHFDGDHKRSVADNSTSTTNPHATVGDVRSADRRESAFWAGKLYLNFPLAKGEFTVGTQDSYTRTTLDYRMFNTQVETYIPSSFSDTRQTAAALFASYSRMFGKFTLSAGARYEYVDYTFRVDGKRDDGLSRNEHLLTPDISLGYSFSDKAQVSLSCKTATVRPPYSRLSGSLSYVGSHEIEGGNPGLRDEKMYDVKFFGMWNGFMLQADYMRGLDTYAYVKQPYPAENLQLLMHPINIDVTSLSLYLIYSKAVKCWTPNITLGMYRQWLGIGTTTYNKPIFSYYFENSFNLSRGWIITANMNGQSSGDMHTNRFDTTWFTLDASVGKKLFNNSLTVKLIASDIFNSSVNKWTMNTFGVFVDKQISYDRRGISLSLIYRFQPRKSNYKGKTASESELNRL